MRPRLPAAASALLLALAAVPGVAAAHSVPGGSLAGIPQWLYLSAGAAVEADPDLVSTLAVEHVWFVLVALVVLGHVLSVRVAHRAALSFFETRKRAVKGGVPMTALMVAYTMVGLWIVSRPFAG